MGQKPIIIKGKHGLIRIWPPGEPTKEEINQFYKKIVEIMVKAQIRQQKEKDQEKGSLVL